MRSLIAISLLAATVAYAEQKPQTTMNTSNPPAAAKKPKTTTIHGETLADDYFWMREKTSPEVIKHLEAENAYTEAVMKPTAALQQKLYDEMLSHVKQTDVNVPFRLGDYFYYSRTEEGKQYPIYCRKKGSLEAPEQIILDPNVLGKGLKFFSVGVQRVSDDGNILAYSTDVTGYRQYTLHFKDLRTGDLLPDRIERVGNVSWAADNKTVFFTTEDAVTKRSNQFYRHEIGTAQNELLFEEKDELYDVFSYRTRDKKFIVLSSSSKTTSESHYVPADDPKAALKLFAAREREHRYSVDHRAGLFYVLTNLDAKNYRLVTVPDSDPSKGNWKELIPHRPAIKLADVDLFANHMVLTELEGGSQKLRVIDFRTNAATPVTFPEPVYALAGADNAEFDTNVFRYRYQSLITPSSVYDYDMDKKASVLLKRTEVPNYDPALYVSERIYAKADDGTAIPVSLVYRKGIKKDGRNPLLLYGYGSYGHPIWPGFNSNRLSLLDRGVIYAIGHIRGGGELGEPWREAGRMMVKRNTFTDFVDVAEHLVKEKYTSKDRLAIQGGSAGGLLVGAAANLRPDLFKAVVAQVPFVDVINTMLDASLPLTTSEYLEWGNPNVEADYRYMKSYSPYDNIAPKPYPATLVEVSLNDSQVPYWEGAKYAAKLRSMTKSSNPVLLKTKMAAGHGGASGRYDALRDVAFTYAFLLTQLGVK